MCKYCDSKDNVCNDIESETCEERNFAVRKLVVSQNFEMSKISAAQSYAISKFSETENISHLKIIKSAFKSGCDLMPDFYETNSYNKEDVNYLISLVKPLITNRVHPTREMELIYKWIHEKQIK